VSVQSKEVINMEALDINGGSGQSFGYIWYRNTKANATAGGKLRITGRVHDIAQVFVNGKLQTQVIQSNDDVNGFGFWKLK